MIDIENGPVVAHAQAFADEGNRLFGTTFKTYNGHDPDRTQALDCWDSLEDRRRLAEFAKDNMVAYGIDYVIHEQRIYNPEVSPVWRQMADRGSITANHFDHVHLSFNDDAPPLPQPTPQPAPVPPTPSTTEGNPMFVCWNKDHTVGFFGYGDKVVWITGERMTTLKSRGVIDLGDCEDSFLDQIGAPEKVEVVSRSES